MNKISAFLTPNIKKYSFYDMLDVRYSDPVIAIALKENFLLIGSALGRISYYEIDKKHQKICIDLSNEGISGCSILNKEEFLFAIGDEEVIKISTQSTEVVHFKNYDSNANHNDFCETSFCMMNENKLILLEFSEPISDTSKISKYDCNYILYTFEQGEERKKEKEVGTINMTNYVVPFDLNFDKFVFLEHFEDLKRKISIFDLKDKSKKHVDISVDFGHFSFFKILPENRFLLVHKYNIIGIYDENLKLIDEIEYDKEIECVDWYLEEDKNLIILLMDNEGYVTEIRWDDTKFRVKSRTNLYDLENISEEIKGKGLYFMEFPYYIKGNKDYIVVTTDYACVILYRST